MTEANFSTADRLVHVLDHLGIERAHFAASMLADVIDFARTYSERIASLTLVCPPRLDPSLGALGSRLLIIAADQGRPAAMVRNAVASLPEAAVVWLPGYFSPPWADVVADCAEQVETAILNSLSNEHAKTPRNLQGDVRGEIAGITYHSRGAGSPLVLLPLSLASSQWDPLLARLSAQFCTVTLGGPELGFLAMLESRGHSSGYLNVVKQIIDALQLKSEEVVLEVGCLHLPRDRRNWTADTREGNPFMPFIKRNEVEIYFETHGQGAPMMFFSETACAGDVWNIFQVPEFCRDHKVITHDYRGTGRSTKPTVQYSTEDFVEDAVAILDHLNAGPAIVCGHSMGGRIIQLLGLKHPTKVKKMIIASSGAGHPGMANGIPFQLCKEMVELGYERYVRDHTLEVGWTPAYLKQNRDKVEQFLEVRLANLPPLESYLRHVIARQEHDTTDRLKDIKPPTLVIVGSDDHVSSTGRSHRKDADILARGIPNATFVEIPGEAHNYFFTNPDAAHKAIRSFLTAS